MMRSLFSAVSGLKNHQTAMDVVGNNISNVNTVGYKSSSVVFSDIFSQTVSSATAPTTTSGGSNAKQIGLGVGISTIKTSTKEGSTQSTDSTLDFSIDGEGYFIVQASDGSNYYTRNGSFDVDSNGYLVTASGDFVLGYATSDSAETDFSTKGLSDLTAIRIAGDPTTNNYTDYAVDGNGFVTAYDLDAEATVVIGRVVTATFANAAGLEKTGDSQYTTSSNSGSPILAYANEDNSGSLNAGSLEMSNVDLATELTNMIIMQRGFQANSRVITTSDSLLEELVNLKR